MMKKTVVLLMVMSLSHLWIFGLGSQEKNEFSLPITQFTLNNGLRVILSEDFSLPIVSVVVVYNVGSLYEKQGKGGLAYLVENLMFQGSRNVGPMQHIRFIQKIGGTLNAATTENKTTFYQTVPSNQIALVLWLESDRMKSLNINPSNVERIRASLIEEIQLRKNSDPYFESSLYFDQLLYPHYAYHHPVFGSVSEVREISVKDMKEFYSTYYTPNNAVLSISGDIDKKKVRQLILKYFSTIAKGKKPRLPALPELPEIQKTETSVTDALAPSPAFHIGYQVAPLYSADYYPLVIAEYLLMRGRTSRLYERLIDKDKTALQLSGGIENRADQSAFKIFVRATNDIMKDRSQRAVQSEINKLKNNLVPEEEFKKSKNMFKMDYARQYATTLDKALLLAEELLNRGSFEALSLELDRYLSVTRYEVSRMVNKYFEDNRIILDVKTK